MTTHTQLRRLVGELDDFFDLIREDTQSELFQSWLENVGEPIATDAQTVAKHVTQHLEACTAKEIETFLRRSSNTKSKVAFLKLNPTFTQFLHQSKSTLIVHAKSWRRHCKISALADRLCELNEFVTDANKTAARVGQWLQQHSQHQKVLQSFDNAFMLALRDDDDLLLQWNEAISQQDPERLYQMLHTNLKVYQLTESKIEALEAVQLAWSQYKQERLSAACALSQSPSSPSSPSSSSSFDNDHTEAKKLIELTYERRQHYHDNLNQLFSLKRRHPDLFDDFLMLTVADPITPADKGLRWSSHQFLARNPGKKSKNVDMKARFVGLVETLQQCYQHIISNDITDRNGEIDQLLLSDYFDDITLNLRNRYISNPNTGILTEFISKIPTAVLAQAYQAYDKHAATTNHQSLSARVESDKAGLDAFIKSNTRLKKSQFLKRFEAKFAYHPLLVCLDLYHHQEKPIEIYQISRRFHDHTRFLDVNLDRLKLAVTQPTADIVKAVTTFGIMADKSVTQEKQEETLKRKNDKSDTAKKAKRLSCG